MNAPVAKAAEDADVEEESNAAEIDGVGEGEMQDDDVGEESYAAEVQVEDTTIVSSDEVPEAEDEVAEAEAAEGTAVENDTNAAELDDSSQYLHLCWLIKVTALEMHHSEARIAFPFNVQT